MNREQPMRINQKPDAKQGTSADGTGPWWKQGVALFGEVTGWIVIPVIGSLYLGQYLDERQGTGSLYFLSLTGIAFVISCTGIGILGTRYIRQMEQEQKKKKNDRPGTT